MLIGADKIFFGWEGFLYKVVRGKITMIEKLRVLIFLTFAEIFIIGAVASSLAGATAYTVNCYIL